MPDVLIQGFTLIVTIAGTALAVSNHLNRRFDSLQKHLARLETEQDVFATKVQTGIESINERLEDVFLYRISANKELIDHRTDRLVDADESLKRVLSEQIEAVRSYQRESGTITLDKIGRIEAKLLEVEQFLSKTTDFQIRVRT